MANGAAWMARKLSDLERKVDAVSRGPRLGNASLDNGNIPVYDEDGNVRLRFGAQDDGTHALKYVQGPPPPAPLAPVVSVDGPVIRVQFVGLSETVPEDFHRVEVHLAGPSGDILSEDSVAASMVASLQDEAVLMATETGQHQVALVAVSMSSAKSVQSPVVTADVELVNLKGALDAVLDNSRGGSNYYTPTPPPGTDHGPDDLWFDTSVDPDTGLTSYTVHRWDPDAQEWVSLEDERVGALEEAQRTFEETVTGELSSAHQAAQNAQAAADSAAEAAGTAQTAADSAQAEAEAAAQAATDKAAAAQAAAEAHANAVAEDERLAAIAAASDDATAKAAAAQAAAEAAAAADAKAKADAAQAAAEAKAAAAQAAADDADAKAEAAQGAAADAMDRANEAHTRAGNAEDAAADAMQAATHNAKNLWSTAKPSGTAPRGTIWFKIDNTTKNVIGQWQQTAGSDTAFGSNWEPRQLTDALFDNIDAGKINTGYLDVAALIRAGAITADKILVGGAGNLLTNPGFTGDGAGWNISAYNPQITESGGPTGEPVLSIQHSSGGAVFPYLGGLGQSASASFAPDLTVVESGKRYAASVWVRAEVDIPVGNAGMGFRLRELGAATLGWSNPSTVTNREVIPANTWAKVQGDFLVPTDTGTWNRLAFGLRANGALNGQRVEFSAPVLLPMVGSTLIEPGSINTGHILAGAITAESGIISSIDAGVITVGFLNGARIEAGTIDTEQLAFGAATGDILSADALNFKTATGLDIRSSSFRAGDSVEITSGYGIRQFGPDGALNVSLPSDGSEAKFRGDLSARTLTATGRMSIQGPGAVSSGGTLELESGVVPPVQAPQVKLEWDRTVLPELDDTEFASGLTFGDGHFWRVITTSTPLSEGGRVRVEKLSPSGALVDGWDTTFRVGVNGVTFLNGLLYILAGRLPAVYGSNKYVDRVVVAYNTAGVEQRRWEYPHYGTGTYQPGIGNDGTNIVIYQSWVNGDMTYRKFNPTTGALRSTHDMPGKMRSNCTGIAFGTFDYADGAKVIIARERVDLMAFVCYDDSPGAEDDVPRSWHAGNLEVPVGLAWDGSRFHSLDQAGNLVSYQSRSSTHHNGNNTDDWWIGNTWWDGVDGGSQTTLGPATRFTWHHRAKINVRAVDPPPGVEGWILYIARHTSTPGDDLFHWVWRLQVSDGNWAFTMPNVVSYWGGTEGPPASNTFPNATPGEIHSVLGNFRVDGTGAGEWGPLTFHQDGSMTGIPKVAGGQVLIPAADGTAGNPVTVTFPAGLFQAQPAVTLTADSSSPSSIQGVTVREATATSMDVRLLRTGSFNTVLHWTAIERTD